ncbi:MAG: hypothetical protein PWQ75_2056 [Methanolobus sp.]|nr:hypothetical protein [Methanolobus sp.]MDK2832304.1 hypothetical protein [Methanolobus sp.]
MRGLIPSLDIKFLSTLFEMLTSTKSFLIWLVLPTLLLLKQPAMQKMKRKINLQMLQMFLNIDL